MTGFGMGLGVGGGGGGVSVTAVLLFVVMRGDVRVRVLRSFRLFESTSALCNAFNPNPLVLKYGFKFLKLVLLPLALQLLLANNSKHMTSRGEKVFISTCVDGISFVRGLSPDVRYIIRKSILCIL